MIPDQAFNENADAQVQPQVKPDGLARAIDRLKDSTIGARKDLKVSRHLFRDEPSYIVHDPVRFQSHRFTQQNYLLLSSLKNSKTLDEIYQDLSQREDYDGDRESFYRFVLDLQMRGLLDLPLNDGSRLYDRYKKQQAAKKKFNIMKVLFLKIPLLNPNQLLDRTVHLAKPLFTKWFVAIWAVMMLASLGLLWMRWDDFVSPLANLLATRNLVILFIVMTALKFWHELGHAYACKINGGAVPDMGAFFMVGMPMAYVDVSSSWSFTSRNQRILVGLGGMYFESISAAIATFIWAFTEPGLINSTAHFVILMASVMTVLFNANPLMRYDGYYVLSDLVGIPNLRSRSTEYSGGLIKWLTLGKPMNLAGKSFREGSWLLCYGVAASVYQFWLMVIITFIVAQKLFVVGMVMAVSIGIKTVVTPVRKIISYLWFSPELEDRRPRAIVVSALLIGLILGAFTFIPVPGGVVTTGQLTYEKVQSVRMPFGGYVSSIDVKAGQEIPASDPILSLTSPDVEDRFHLAAARRKVALRHVTSAATASAAIQQQRKFESQTAEGEFLLAESEFAKQHAKADFDGVVLKCPNSWQLGSYLEPGAELARIGNGVQIVRAVVDVKQFTSVGPKVGAPVTVRIATSAGRSVTGKIGRVEPQGTRNLDMEGLSQAAGGDILTVGDGVAAEIYFVIDIKLDEPFPIDTPEKTTAYIRFDRKFKTLGSLAIGSFLNFTNKLFSK